MRKLTILAITIIPFWTESCKKNYTCSCTTVIGSTEPQSYTQTIKMETEYKHVKKSDVEIVCNNYTDSTEYMSINRSVYPIDTNYYFKTTSKTCNLSK